MPGPAWTETPHPTRLPKGGYGSGVAAGTSIGRPRSPLPDSERFRFGSRTFTHPAGTVGGGNLWRLERRMSHASTRGPHCARRGGGLVFGFLAAHSARAAVFADPASRARVDRRRCRRSRGLSSFFG